MRMKLCFLALAVLVAPCVAAWGGPVTYTYTGQVVSTFIELFGGTTQVTIEAIGGGGGNSPAFNQGDVLNGTTPGGAGADVTATFTLPIGLTGDEPISIWVGGQGGTPQY